MFGYYCDYRDKCLDYRDITFSIIAQPYYALLKTCKIFKQVFGGVCVLLTPVLKV